MIIFDPGHGGSDRGAQVDGYDEADLNLNLGLHALKIGRDRKLEVGLTRFQDKHLDWDERYSAAVITDSRGVISIHHNAGSDTRWHGAEAYHWPTNHVTAELGSYGLALLPSSVVTRRVIPAVNLPGKKWLQRPRTVLKGFKSLPVLLLEIGYMSNAMDLREVTRESFVIDAADALIGIAVRFENLLDEREKKWQTQK